MESQEAPSEKRVKLEKVLWGKTKNNITSQVYERLYLDEKTADVYFICKGGDRISAHKCILSKSSPVFDAMFYGPNASECDKDYSKWAPDVFKDFLKLSYLDEVVIDPDNIIGVMELSHESQMVNSLKLCGEMWANNMTIDDVCRAYHWAIHFEMDELKEFCERKIMVFPKEIFETSYFLICGRAVFNRILELDTLLCDEKIVLQACLNWASKACEQDGLNVSEIKNLLTFLEKSLYKVRYSSMTSTEFREVVDSKDGHFFDISDYEDIIRLTTGTSKLKTANFITTPRSSLIPWKEDRAIEWNVCKYQLVPGQTRTILDGDTLKFGIQCSRTILLGEFHWASLSRAILTITQTSSTEKTNIVHTIDHGFGHFFIPVGA